MSGSDHAARLQALQKLASSFPGESTIEINLGWENEISQAGVASEADGLRVYLNGASEQVGSTADAADLLRQIFADEIVCVSAFERGSMVHCGLAPKDDPSAGFTALDPPGGSNMPVIDEVLVETWSKGLLD